MSYKWKPSASQKREFAAKMQDPEEKAAYYQRKEDKAVKRRLGSNFDYNSAGGKYVPTKAQYDFTMSFNKDLTPEQREAFNMVQYGYNCQEKVHHDFIHIVNEILRSSI